jgi:hypothetical protein
VDGVSVNGTEPPLIQKLPGQSVGRPQRLDHVGEAVVRESIEQQDVKSVVQYFTISA